MKKLLVMMFTIIMVLLIGTIIYLNIYYHSENSVKEYLVSSDSVKVEKIKEGYFFDGPGTSDALIFYPGAKVEYTAYAPIMNKLAYSGIDTYLISMPFNIAFLDSNKAANIMKKYKYDNWYLSGHSLGGVVISNYASKHSKNIKGVILLASYPNKKIPNNIKLLSIYGTNDKVLNIKKYKKSKKYLPNNYKEIIIDGGNHANYGNYGSQKYDGKSSITKGEQQDITVKSIVEFIR